MRRTGISARTSATRLAPLLLAASLAVSAETPVPNLSQSMQASALIGRSVENREGDNLGTIADLIVNRFGQVDYAVLHVGGLVGPSDRLIPFNLLQFGIGETGVVLDSNYRELNEFASFAEVLIEEGGVGGELRPRESIRPDRRY